ncbi:putative transcription factor WD40-like family [Helianthus annuus]|nr:putative transcription factor WD40-like family [Helianthus annuus]KAJ0957371.1 putative transcription factor WD40-like family [Helianthus annuus]
MDVGHCYLDGNTDVEFFPRDSFHHVLAASTYTLQEGDQPRRSGSISLFSVDLDRVNLSYRLKTAGIFDMKWNPVGANATHPLLAQADADGFLRVHHLKNSINGDALKEVHNQKVSSSMCLCLDWNPSATSISTGLSDGLVSLISIDETKTTVLQEWKAHDFEVWAASFNPDQPHLVYTGSDDCKFKGWDLRNNPSKIAFQNSKAHQMGVSCIAKSSHDPNTLFTGSYDENLRVWDVRSISRPVNETSINLGGGVWRMKNHYVVPGLILAACMHNGFAIVKVDGNEVKVVETYNKHDSLAYGADWYRGSIRDLDNKVKTIVATCSFYDKLLRVWVPENDTLI